MSEQPRRKPLEWIGSSRRDLRRFPEDVKDEMGFALDRAQLGGKHVSAKPLKGFGGANVLAIVEDHEGDTYRAVYTVKFKLAVYVLHAFQKKSTKGIKTPHHMIELIRQRLKQAEQHYKEHYEQSND
jgi:phage-related protein